MTSVRRIVTSPAFLAAWALAGIPPAAMLCHDVALAATTGAAIGAGRLGVAMLAQSGVLVALRMLAGAAEGSGAGTSLDPEAAAQQQLSR